MKGSLLYSASWERVRNIVVLAEIDCDRTAQRELGKIYAFGVDEGDADDAVRSDAAQAFKWLALAANRGDAEAYYVLAQCSDPRQIGFIQEPDIALSNYREALRLGYTDAALAIAELHLNGICSNASPAHGWRILLHRAYRGERAAQLRIAELLEPDGRNVMSAAWRLLAGADMRHPPKGAQEVAGLLRQVCFYFRLVDSGDELTYANMRNWLKASFTP